MAVDSLDSFLHVNHAQTASFIISLANRLNVKSLTVILDALGISQPQESDKVYVVKPGDSLGEIALKHKTSISNLKKLNNLNNDRIIVGQKIKVP